MADDPNGVRVYPEGEHFTLMDAAVARETASRDAKITELEAANTALGTKVDTLETEKAQAISAKEAAEQALEQHKTEETEKAAREARKSTRLAEVAAANPHLDLNEETAADRVERIVAFDEAAYAGYLADMKLVGAATAGTDLTPGGPGRETAALTPTPTPPGDKKATVSGVFSAARATREGS